MTELIYVIRIGSDKGLAPNGCQGISWTNVGQEHWVNIGSDYGLLPDGTKP